MVARRCVALAATSGLLTLGLVPRSAAPTPQAGQATPSYPLDVDLVRLSVTARDGKGSLVHDLTAEDFRVFDAGQEQAIALFGHHEARISVVVLFDHSASMAGDKLMHAKDAVSNFVRAFRPAQDEVLLVAFSHSVKALGRFGLDLRTVQRAAKGIEVEGDTRLYDAVIEAARAIATPGRHEKRAILILSDGEDTASRAKLEDAAEAVRSAGVPVYAIAIEMEEEARGEPEWRRLDEPPAILALRRLTDGTGGWTFPVAAARRCTEVCLRVAEELRNQYLLGYPAPAPRGGPRWRGVDVQTRRPGVVLSTRAGYYSAPEELAPRSPER